MIQAEKNSEFKQLLKESPTDTKIRMVSRQFLTEDAKKMWTIYKMRFQFGGTYQDIADKYEISRQRAEQIVQSVDAVIEKIFS